MSNLLNHDKSKDKKKSIVERFVNFASQTMRISKKSDKGSRKKKQKKSSNKKSHTTQEENIRILSSEIQVSKDNIQMCTFCDYCDREIVTDFTGQNIVYHNSCNEYHQSQRTLNCNTMSEATLEKTDPLNSDTLCRRETSTFGTVPSKLSVSLNDIGISGLTLSDSLEVRGRDLYLSDTETGSYTFSTMDLNTIKQFGIAIKKVESVESGVFLGHVSIDIAPVVDSATSRSSNSLNYQTLLPQDLRTMMDVFNNNDQGLLVEPVCDQIMGKIRVFINLLRPIKMLLTARPPSIFDLFPENGTYENQRTIDRAYYNTEVIFWLPRGTTKLLYININCTTSDVISLLLSKFNIQNNPKKFSLYEHFVKSAKEVEVRKLRPSQCPLKIMMDWCTKDTEYYHHNLVTKRFVLQENDPGSIEWDDFSVPELRSFLLILDMEEKEKSCQVMRKFDILQSEIYRRLAIKKNIRQETGDVDV